LSFYLLTPAWGDDVFMLKSHLQKSAKGGRIYGVQKKNNCRIQWDDCYRQNIQKFNPRFLHFYSPTLCRI
ncbi:MAG: hypothetical protein IJY77_00870, partial [Alphaproteobacteria bacterium]|nr:hypothetical protein [Alphaproteobacteria bacterium]